MRKLTKSDLLGAAVLVATLLAVTIAASPADSASSRVMLYSLFGMVVVVYVAAEVVIRIVMKQHGSSLDEPVPDFASNAIKNTVSIVWLLVVALLMVLLVTRHGQMFAATLAVPMIAAVVGGRVLQARVRSTSLLPYSFTFLLALFAAFAIERLGGWR